MKKNVTYKLKKEWNVGSYFLFGGQKIYVDLLTQEQMKRLFNNGVEHIEIIEEKPTNTNDKKKKYKK